MHPEKCPLEFYTYLSRSFDNMMTSLGIDSLLLRLPCAFFRTTYVFHFFTMLWYIGWVVLVRHCFIYPSEHYFHLLIISRCTFTAFSNITFWVWKWHQRAHITLSITFCLAPSFCYFQKLFTSIFVRQRIFISCFMEYFSIKILGWWVSKPAFYLLIPS